MSDDLAQLLRSADGGPAQPDTADIARRGRRLRATRSIAVIATIAIGATGVVGIAVTAGEQRSLPVITEAPPTAPTSEPTEENDRTGDASESEQPGASQSPADAERDGVLAEIAALPFDVRVGPMWSDAGTQDRIVTDEGVWVVSRPDQERIEPDARLRGDPTGLYGRDYIHLSGYGEVLLLDADETEILRAYPFPEVGPHALAATDEAVYCTRQGDGGIPDSMLCRIDRESLEALVRVFPWDDTSQFLLEPVETYVPDHWIVDEPVGEVLFGDLQVIDGELVSVGQEGHARVDPDTLELLEEDAGPDEVTSQDERLIADLLRLASGPSPQDAGRLPFAEEVQLGLGPDLHVARRFDELGEPEAWVIDVVEFRAFAGPFSALELAAHADADDLVVSVGDHDHCASPPVPPPDGLTDLRRVSVQPDLGDRSCVEWWTVDLFVADDGSIAAVTLDLYEP